MEIAYDVDVSADRVGMMQFEWDESKDRDNQRKHGVDFEDAKAAFLDGFGRLIPDPDHSAGEERFILLGMSAHGLLVVCHSEPTRDTIRIISARRASPHERRQYEELQDA